MSSYQGEKEIIDVGKRRSEILTILDDPTLFPVTFLGWLKRYVEQSGLTLPASSIIGSPPPAAMRLRNLSAGLVVPVASGSPPSGTLLCDGSSYERSDYPGLFLEIGTRYGSDTPTSFKVPNLVDSRPGFDLVSYVVTTGQ